jgi:dienelactone hydrolase
MTRLRHVIVVALITALPLAARASENLVGVIGAGTGAQRVEIRFDAAAGAVSGLASLPLLGKEGLPLSGHAGVRGLELRFGNISLTVRRHGTGYDGTTVKHEPVHLVRVAILDDKSLDAVAGLYEFSPGQIIDITRFRAGLVFTDFKSGRTGALLPLSESRFIAGPGVAIPLPAVVRISVRRTSGEVTSITYAVGGLPGRRARRIRFRKEEIEFQSGNVHLSGTLTLPNGRPPFPATLRIAGAGPLTRANSAEKASAYHGIAFFSYDKRGTGKSTGNWRGTSVKDLADDARAALDVLKRRSDIDPRRLSIGAGSEGAWPAAVLVGENPNLASVALYAGPVLSYLDEYFNEVRADLIRHGFGGRDLEDALAFERRVHDLVRHGELNSDAGWAELNRLVETHRDTTWIHEVVSWPRGDVRWTKFLAMAPYDPSDIWKTTHVPIFAAYGGKDQNVPAAANIDALQRDVRSSGNSDVLIRLFPNANHEFMDAKTGDLDQESPYLTRYVPVFFAISFAWAKRHPQAANLARHCASKMR